MKITFDMINNQTLVILNLHSVDINHFKNFAMPKLPQPRNVSLIWYGAFSWSRLLVGELNVTARSSTVFKDAETRQQILEWFRLIEQDYSMLYPEKATATILNEVVYA